MIWTGRFRFRRTLFGRMVVEVQARRPASSPGDFECVWVKATQAQTDTILIATKGRVAP